MSWFRRQPDLDDAELRDALIALRSLRRAPDPDTEARHLAAIRAAATLPAAPAATAEPRASAAWRLPRRSRFAVALLAALLATSGLAVAGELPAPVQSAAAAAARTVGVGLPDASEADEAGRGREAEHQRGAPEPTRSSPDRPATEHPTPRTHESSERDATGPAPSRRSFRHGTSVNPAEDGARDDDGDEREPAAPRVPESDKRDRGAGERSGGGETEDSGASADGDPRSGTTEQSPDPAGDDSTDEREASVPAPAAEADGDPQGD